MFKRRLFWVLMLLGIIVISYWRIFQFRIIKQHTYQYIDGYNLGGDFLIFNDPKLKIRLENDGEIVVDGKCLAKAVILIPIINELIIEDLKTGKKGHYLDVREFVKN